MTDQAFRVEGGHRLQGELIPQGAKNEALQILCAVMLTKEKMTIENVPEILDVKKLISLLTGLGVTVTKIGKGHFEFQAANIDLDYLASPEYQADAKKIRGSVMLMGPLLARYKKAYLPKPGGDKIGRRNLDTHFHGFEKLGARFEYNEKEDKYLLEGSDLEGTYILMDEISVTGTANLVMAAVMAKGKTTLFNAACEPYLVQLCNMLNRMGAKIEGVGSNRLEIEGVSELNGTHHRVMPDMIEIGSFIGLAAMTQSHIRIKDAFDADLGVIPRIFEKIGVKLEQQGKDLIIPEQKKYKISSFINGSILTVYDAPWPGFTPDLMSILLVTAIQAKGSVLIHQKMFESRLFFVDKLIDMGAKIILCDPHRATVIGLNRESQLRGITMSSPDIRAGVSLLIAAMSADGVSTIHNIEQIDRGYFEIDKRLNAIGAKIERINT